VGPGAEDALGDGLLAAEALAPTSSSLELQAVSSSRAAAVPAARRTAPSVLATRSDKLLTTCADKHGGAAAQDGSQSRRTIVAR